MLDMLYTIVIQPLVYTIEVVFTLFFRVTKNPGLAIVGVSLVVNVLCLPLYRMADARQREERDRQRRMERWVGHIKRYFSGDEQYMMLSTYYREQGYSPIMALGGSVSLLLQIPIFMAAYGCLSSLRTLEGASFLGIADLGRPDAMIALGGMTVNLLPLLMTLLNVVSSAVYTKDLLLRDKVQAYGLALLFLVLLYGSPSGLVLYWTCNQVFSLVKNLVTARSENPRRTVGVLMQVGVVPLAYGTLTLIEGRSIRWYLCFGLGLVVLELCALHLMLPNGLLGAVRKAPGEGVAPRVPRFVVAACLVTVLLGGVIPSALVASSPAEFMSLNNFAGRLGHSDPLSYVWENLAIVAGALVVWGGIVYALADSSTKGRIEGAYVFLCLCTLADFFVFKRDLGIVTRNLVFESVPKFPMREQLMGVVAVCACAAATAVLMRKAGRAVTPILGITLAALVALTARNVVRIEYVVRDELVHIEQQAAGLFDEDGNTLPQIALSRTEPNVVIVFMDRAINEFVPYILEEKPYLVDKLDGFTWYSNTIAHGTFTVFGAPSIYGGYEYTPSAMNARPDELLVNKHNEALRVLPSVFAASGFDATVLDPALVNYKFGSEDVSIFDGMDGVRARCLAGAYTDKVYPEFAEVGFQNRWRSFLGYSLFKASPPFMRGFIYNRGKYLTAGVSNPTRATFLDEYATLESLPELTRVEDKGPGQFLIMHNEATHNPGELQLPDYVPSTNVSNGDLFPKSMTVDGRTMRFAADKDRTHYMANMATFLALTDWFDWMRAEGVYDNTRIIVVSDHGRTLGQFKDLILEDGFDLERVSALFLEKDFDAHGFEVSNEFMTIADTPTLATAGLIEDPTNPFTGNPITDDEKTAHDQLVTASAKWDAPSEQMGTVFDTSDAGWYSVHDDMHDLSNWKKVE